jgi:hypothetical protein
LFIIVRLKVRAKRPLRILASYHTETGEYVERELHDFEARVFSHEFDHILGVPFIHWTVSEGEIELKEDYMEEDFENLLTTIEHYRNRLYDERLSKPNLFESFDLPFLNVEDRDEQFMLSTDLKKQDKLNFEEIMLIDIEKAIKKDLRLLLKADKNILI